MQHEEIGLRIPETNMYYLWDYLTIIHVTPQN